MKKRILVVEDDAPLARVLCDNFGYDGFDVEWTADARRAVEKARAVAYDLIVLDLMLPGLSGYDVLAELRKRDETRDVGVILLTARRDEPDRIRGLSLGADDYLMKPFSPAELVLRVQALLRRLVAPAVAGGSTLVAEGLTIDRAAHRVSQDGVELNLTATEYKLLVTLLERRGRVQSRPQLLETVWDAQPDIQTRTVDMHVQRLRTKLGEVGEMIETVRGFGYRFKPADRGTKGK